MGVDHRRRDVVVPEQLLNGPNIGAPLQEPCGETVAEGVAGHLLGDPAADGGELDRFLDGGLVQVVAPNQAGARILREVPGGEYILPDRLRVQR